MGKVRLKLTKNQRGMTLIELMAVVVILGILATIAGVAIVNASEKSKVAADTTTIAIIKDAAQRYIMDDPDASTLSVYKLDGSLDTPITIPAQKLVDHLYLREIPKDSANKTLKEVIFTKDSDNWIWKFNSTETGADNDFAPKANK